MSVAFIDAFQDLRTILCICPCCGELVRASELHLSAAGKAPKTWLDEYEAELTKLEKREEGFDEKEAEIKEKARQRGREKAVEKACSCLDSSIARFNYNPYDIKAVYHPVDFVVFDGLNTQDDLEYITFLAKKSRDNPIQTSLQTTIKSGNFSWKMAKITDEGGVEFK